jgi:DNA repair protein RecO (recombination protein O)
VRRQRLYRAQCIVLKRMDLGEADRILTLYSRQHGKLRAVAKGVRRATSRSAGHLELFTLTDVQLAVGRELDVISQADTVTSFRHVREDVMLITHGYYLVELADALTGEHLENEAVFDALVDGLTALGHQRDARQVVITYLLRLLDALGFRPELRECVNCRTAIAPGANAFSSFLGGVLCPGCGPREASGRPIENERLKLLRFLQQSAGQRYVAVPDAVGRDAEMIVRDYAEQIVERRLRTPALIAQMRQVDAIPASQETSSAAR